MLHNWIRPARMSLIMDNFLQKALFSFVERSTTQNYFKVTIFFKFIGCIGKWWRFLTGSTSSVAGGMIYCQAEICFYLVSAYSSMLGLVLEPAIENSKKYLHFVEVVEKPLFQINAIALLLWASSRSPHQRRPGKTWALGHEPPPSALKTNST